VPRCCCRRRHDQQFVVPSCNLNTTFTGYDRITPIKSRQTARDPSGQQMFTLKLSTGLQIQVGGGSEPRLRPGGPPFCSTGLKKPLTPLFLIACVHVSIIYFPLLRTIHYKRLSASREGREVQEGALASLIPIGLYPSRALPLPLLCLLVVCL